jgi:hypothetical protein
MPPSRTPPHLFSSRTLLALQTTAYSRTPDKRSHLCKSNPLEGWWFALHSNKCLLSKCETRSKKEKTKHIIGSPRYGRESATLLKHKRQVSNGVRSTELELALQLLHARNEVTGLRTHTSLHDSPEPFPEDQFHFHLYHNPIPTRLQSPYLRTRGRIQGKAPLAHFSPDIHFSCMCTYQASKHQSQRNAQRCKHVGSKHAFIRSIHAEFRPLSLALPAVYCTSKHASSGACMQVRSTRRHAG